MASSLHGNENYHQSDTKPLVKCQEIANHFTERAEIAARLSGRYEKLLRSGKYYDCYFNVANTKIGCHKLILASASPVFEAMFYGPIRENQSVIEIDDISPDIFQLLITYVYAGYLNFESMSLEETIELYYSAEKYLLSDLTQSCLLAVTRKLRFDNILPALELSIYMNLTSLLDVCMSFFARCCLGDPQYMGFMKSKNQHHVSKECIKTIIAANKNLHNQLLWFVLEWCQQECHELGLEKDNFGLIIDDLDLEKSDCNLNLMEQSSTNLYQTLERTYYKACRPFIIDQEANTWKLVLKSEHFISLHGLTLQSRLVPTNLVLPSTFSNEYNENFVIEIRTRTEREHQDHEAAGQAEPFVWRYVVCKKPTKYNCDLNIRWNEGVVLSPDFEYEVKLSWSTDAFGAEYPCSFMSNKVDGIEFRDSYSYSGSIVKGLTYVNLV